MNNFLDLLSYLNYFLDLSFDSNEFLYYSVHWHWNLDWNSECFVNLNYFLNLTTFWYYSIHLNFSWNFNSNLYNFFTFFFNDSNDLVSFLIWNNFLNDFFYNSVNFIVNVLNDFNFFNSFLNDWNLN